MRGSDDVTPRQARYGLRSPPLVYRTREDAIAYFRLVEKSGGAARRLLSAPGGEWWVVDDDDADLLSDEDGFSPAD